MKKFFKLAIFVGLIVALVKFVSEQKAEWMGLSEPELRDKLHTKLDEKIPSEKVDEIADKITEEMRKRGVLGEDAPAEDEPAATE